jgi:chloramphenicol-sensitive protein RarD
VSRGASAALAAYVLWGLSSLYWRLLADVPSLQLLCFRVISSLLVLVVLLAASGKLRALFSAGRNLRTLLIYAGSGLSVAINWAAFMWGSIHGHVVETGLGYLLAPLVSVIFGVLFLRERLDRMRGLAVVLMTVGVGSLILRGHDLHAWIYLSIGLTFGAYSLLRKLGPLDSLTSLALETGLLTAWVGLGAASGILTIDYVAYASPKLISLLCLCGVISIVPLWLFSVANRSLRLADLGFFQYALPTTQFILAITIYDQPLSINTLASLAIIWSALGIVVVSTLVAPRHTA